MSTTAVVQPLSRRVPRPTLQGRRRGRALAPRLGRASSAQLWLLGYLSVAIVAIVAIVADGHRLEATLVHQTTTVQRVAEAGRHHLPGVAQSVDAADLVPVVRGDRPFGDAGTRVEQLQDDLGVEPEIVAVQGIPHGRQR